MFLCDISFNTLKKKIEVNSRQRTTRRERRKKKRRKEQEEECNENI